MSWISGILNTDGSPVDSELLGRMARSVAQCAPDCENTWVDDSIGMAYSGFHTTEESRGEKGPLHNPAGACRICCDGRVDNRQELAGALRSHGVDCEGLADGELILHAYELWGTDCLDRLNGDFAFVIWDALRHRLFCARDTVGVRPFFYHFDGRTFMWASRLRQILSAQTACRHLNEEYFANFLVRGTLPLECTPYRDVSRLQPGHCLVLENGKLSRRMYWDLEAVKEVRYQADSEYEEHFRQLLFEAVRTRLRSTSPVWSELSGGLDSSSIVCIARELSERGGAPSDGLGTLSVVYDRAQRSDERQWIRTVVEKCGVQDHYFVWDQHPPFWGLTEARQHWDEPYMQSLFFGIYQGYIEQMRAGGARVLLSGLGADQVLLAGAPPLHIADLARHGQFRTAWAEASRWQRHLRMPLLTVWAMAAFRPLFRPTLAFYRTDRRSERDPVPSWIDPAFARRMQLKERALRRHVSPGYASPCLRWHCERTLEVSEYMLRGYVEDRCECRYPFLDRRLVEFLLGTPWTQLVRTEHTKSLLRRAMRGILPEAVLQRKNPRGPDHAIYLGLASEWPKLEPFLRKPIIAELGFVDRDAFHKALKLARNGAAPSLPLLLTSLALENWLQAPERAPRPRAPLGAVS